MAAGLAIIWTARQRREGPARLVVTGTIEATQVDIGPRIMAPTMRSIRSPRSARGTMYTRPSPSLGAMFPHSIGAGVFTLAVLRFRKQLD